jgi:hypothetical protein
MHPRISVLPCLVVVAIAVACSSPSGSGGGGIPIPSTDASDMVDASHDDDAVTPMDAAPDSSDPCVTNCADKECGPNYCGGTCGKCPDDKPLCEQGHCKVKCVPACDGKSCGPNGCGGSCGNCPTSAINCVEGKCTAPPAELPLYASCFAKAQKCVAGTSCMANAMGNDWLCMPEVAAGAKCGSGLGQCQKGAKCLYTTEGMNESRCYADVGVGSACGDWGLPFCDDATSCSLPSPESQEGQCYAKVGAGAECLDYGIGDCQDGLVCLYLDVEQSTSAVCKPRGPVGSVCDKDAGCVKEAECVYQTAERVQTICTLPGKEGESCTDWGKSPFCQDWLACVPDSADEGAPAKCMPVRLAGQTCGYKIGACATMLQCAYTDASMATQKCVLAKGKGDWCGFNTAGCLGNYVCDYTGDKVCVDACEVLKLYGDGTCQTDCPKFDPDCG